MRKDLLEELRGCIVDLERREDLLEKSATEVEQRERAVTAREEEYKRKAVELEEKDRKAENILAATSDIRRELALRSATIKTLREEAAVREARLTESRAEKGRLKEQLAKLTQTVAPA
jgi:chromosome segregation ATPase